MRTLGKWALMHQRDSSSRPASCCHRSQHTQADAAMCSHEVLCSLCTGSTCRNAASSAASTCRKYSFWIGSRLKNALQKCNGSSAVHTDASHALDRGCAVHKSPQLATVVDAIQMYPVCAPTQCCEEEVAGMVYGPHGLQLELHLS